MPLWKNAKMGIYKMENKQKENSYGDLSNPTPDQFNELMQKFFRLRYKLVLPEYAAQFKQQIIEDLKESKMVSREDIHFIMRIFMFLANSKKPPTMGEISSELNTPLSTATRIIDWLVHIHIVERISDPDDRRVVRICMSEKGNECYQIFLDSNKKRIERLMSHFTTDEQIQFINISSKLLDLLITDQEHS
jgi:DNA-binding MarR family transcriptional regulator